MKMKRFTWLLMAALVVGLSMSVTSCKDDDDDKNSEQRNEDADPLDTDEAETAWRWLNALTSAEKLDANWATKTYEPTVGVASENNANTRIVVVNSLDEAKSKFASLSGVAVSELGGEKTVSQGGVGKLTWTPSKAGAQNLAEVKVDTKLIPHLQKIIYCTEDQVGENGGLFGDTVTGTAYYRLGDVVKDKEGFYWVCVRPSFDQGNKGKSHWINLFNGHVDPGMPKDYIYSKYNNVKKYNNRTILLPTQLKSSREHMTNLSNLFFALLNPQRNYEDVLGSDKNKANAGLCGFDYKYHGKNFLTNVARFWDNTKVDGMTIWEVLFNNTHEKLEDTKNMILLYKGYRWRVGTTGYVWEFSTEPGFNKTIPGSEDGDMKLYSFGDRGYDINRYNGNSFYETSVENPPQFGSTGHYYWVVRYKTGQELMVNGDYSPYEHLNGCTDIYRYNAKTSYDAHSDILTDDKVEVMSADDIDPELFSNAPKNGDPVYMLGDVLEDKEGSRWFCIAGSPSSSQYPLTTDRTAWFVSFDNVTYNDYAATNIVSEDDVIAAVWRLGEFWETLLSAKEDDEWVPLVKMSKIVKHIRDYAGVDFENLSVMRDSILHFYRTKDNTYYDSNSCNFCMNFAYDDGSRDKQPLIRFIFDFTRGGSKRDKIPDGTIKEWIWRFYKHYQVYDTLRMEKLTQVEKDMRMTTYDLEWAVDQSAKITLQDVANIDYVRRYAAHDKWVTLPLRKDNNYTNRVREKARTEAYASVRPKEFLYQDGKYVTNKTHIYNEPVAFMRVMKLKDTGVKNNKLPLTSTDGRTFKVVHLQNDARLYKTGLATLWSIPYSIERKASVYLDGKLYELPDL